MRLALFCDDPALSVWLDATGGDSAHEVVAAVITSDRVADTLRKRHGIRIVSGWEDLLIERNVDAILVGGAEPSLLEGIRQLASAGRTLFILPQTSQSLMFFYELGLIRDDNHVKLIPAMAARCDTALVRLKSLIDEAKLGRVRLIQCERGLPSGSSSEPIPLTTVDEMMLHDVELLGWLGGAYDQVTAIRTGSANEAVVTQTVTLAGRDLPEATWQVTGIPGGAVRRLTVHADKGRAVAEYDAGNGGWCLSEPDGTKTTGDRVAAARRLLDDFGQVVAEPATAETRSPVEWQDLIRAFEIVDATHRSIRRRRTIELHFEQMSERAAFKSQMTAMGCSVLMVTLLLMLVYLGVASLVPAPDPSQPTSAADFNDGWKAVRAVMSIARYLVFAPLAVFLLLQLFYPLSRPGEAEQTGRVDHKTKRDESSSPT